MADEETSERIATLERELAELKAKAAIKPPPPPSEADIAAHRDQMRKWEDARMSHAAPFSREDLRAMEAACPTSAVQEEVRAARRPQGPGSQLPQDFGKEVHPSPARLPPGGGLGVAREIPFGPLPGQRWIEQQFDHQDAKDRQALIEQEARRRAYEEQIDREARMRLALKGRE